jgi:hypothetical protein
MSGACGMYGKSREVHKEFWWGNLRVIVQLEDRSLDLMIILKLFLKKRNWEVVNWISLAQDTDSWWAVVKEVMKFRAT